MKALFYGGAFNPPTNAHLDLSELALKKTGFDKVIFVPTKSKYILSQEGKEFSFLESERLQMLKLLAKKRSFMEISDAELVAKEQPRTYFTMKEIQKKGYELKLLLGSDWLHKESVSKWLYLKEIALEFGFVVFVRNGDNVRELIEENSALQEFKNRFFVINPPSDYYKISSSKVRELLTDFKKNEMAIKRMVPSEIFEYLKERKND